MSGLGRIAVTPVITSGGLRTFKHDAVTCGMSVIEFLGPGEKEPKGRLKRSWRKGQRRGEPIDSRRREYGRDGGGGWGRREAAK
jgi:hypothetical protein